MLQWSDTGDHRMGEVVALGHWLGGCFLLEEKKGCDAVDCCVRIIRLRSSLHSSRKLFDGMACGLLLIGDSDRSTCSLASYGQGRIRGLSLNVTTPPRA